MHIFEIFQVDLVVEQLAEQEHVRLASEERSQEGVASM